MDTIRVHGNYLWCGEKCGCETTLVCFIDL